MTYESIIQKEITKLSDYFSDSVETKFKDKGVRHMKLYEISEELIGMVEVLEESDGEIDTEALSILENTKIQHNEKILNIARIVKNYESDIKELKEEEERLRRKRKTKENQIAYLKDYTKKNMELTGIETVKDSLFKVSIRNTKPKLWIDKDKEKELMQTFSRIKKELDKQAIRNALEDGNTVEGAKLIENKALYIL